jgi:prevent-host-death family protein
MARQISLRDANQHFARLVREVESGAEIEITRRGEPVARLVPVSGKRRKLTPEQRAALDRLLALGKQARPLKRWKFNRDEIYDERINELLKR